GAAVGRGLVVGFGGVVGRVPAVGSRASPPPADGVGVPVVVVVERANRTIPATSVPIKPRPSSATSAIISQSRPPERLARWLGGKAPGGTVGEAGAWLCDGAGKALVGAEDAPAGVPAPGTDGGPARIVLSVEAGADAPVTIAASV